MAELTGLLEASIDSHVVISTSDNSRYTGTLKGFDVYANVLLHEVKLEDMNTSEMTEIKACLVNGSFINHIDIQCQSKDK